jgi:anti-anti-sigma factor
MLKVHAKRFGSVAVLCLRGRIVRGELAALRTAVNSQFGVTAVVLDLSGASTIDAGGLGAMLELREQTGAKNIEFKLMNLSKIGDWILEITRLNSVFEVTSGAELVSQVPLDRPAPALALSHCA